MTYPAFVEQLAPAPASNLAAPPPDVSLSSSKTEQIPPTSETSPRALLAYALRFFACLLTMEIVLHTMYVVALKDAGKGWWNGMTPAEVSLVGFWNLIIVWLKVRMPDYPSFGTAFADAPESPSSCCLGGSSACGPSRTERSRRRT